MPKLRASKLTSTRARPKNSTIVDVEDGRLNGDVKVTTKQVEYKAEMSWQKVKRPLRWNYQL